MINLLPTEDKIFIKKEYLRRLSVIIGIFSFSFVCAAIFLLLPSYFLTISQKKTFESQLGVVRESLNRQDASKIEADVNDLNAKLAFFSGQKGGERLSEMINLIVEDRGKGISLSHFSYQKGKGVEGDAILLHGKALTRKDFLAFMEFLGNIEGVKNVESPPSNLLKTENISFTLRLELILSGLKFINQ